MIPSEFWIVVSQYDRTPCPGYSSLPPPVPMVWESGLMTKEEAVAKAKAINSKGGWVHVMKVVSNRGDQDQ